MDRRAILKALALAPLAATNAQGEGSSADGLTLKLAANLVAGAPPLATGLHWRVFSSAPQVDGSHALMRESKEAQPTLILPAGDYVVHVAFGLASVAERVLLEGQSKSLQLTLNAGALRIVGVLGEQKIDPNRLTLAIYVSERNNPLAKLVTNKARAGDVIGVPEGPYHIVSTVVQLSGPARGAAASAQPTNSIANADIKVAAGKVVDVTLRHRFATATLKLVSAPGSEAIANTAFTVLTPGGDLIGELIGAFPSMVLAEGDYVAIARHDGKTYQSEFTVQSGQDHDVEIVAKEGQ